MKQIVIGGIVLAILIASVFISVYAHNQASSNTESWWGYMDAMHDSMAGGISDSSTRAAVEDMHDACEQSFGISED